MQLDMDIKANVCKAVTVQGLKSFIYANTGCRRALSGWKCTMFHLSRLVSSLNDTPPHSRWKLSSWEILMTLDSFAPSSQRRYTLWMKLRETHPGGATWRAWEVVGSSPPAPVDADGAPRVSRAWKRSAESHESPPSTPVIAALLSCGGLSCTWTERQNLHQCNQRACWRAWAQEEGKTCFPGSSVCLKGWKEQSGAE